MQWGWEKISDGTANTGTTKPARLKLIDLMRSTSLYFGIAGTASRSSGGWVPRSLASKQSLGTNTSTTKRCQTPTPTHYSRYGGAILAQYPFHSFHSESVGVGKIWTSVRNYEERENGDVVIPGEVGLAVLWQLGLKSARDVPLSAPVLPPNLGKGINSFSQWTAHLLAWGFLSSCRSLHARGSPLGPRGVLFRLSCLSVLSVVFTVEPRWYWNCNVWH